MSELWLPKHLRKERTAQQGAQRQMSVPVVFWHNKKLDYIMNAVGPWIVPPPGYERVECRHAHEVEKWSARLTAQQKRVRDMEDEERFQYEDRIRADAIAGMRKQLEECVDEVNRRFMVAAIAHAEQSRERARPEHTKIETHMACEAEEGVAS